MGKIPIYIPPDTSRSIYGGPIEFLRKYKKCMYQPITDAPRSRRNKMTKRGFKTNDKHYRSVKQEII